MPISVGVPDTGTPTVPTMTTAEALGAFARELQAEDLPYEVVNALINHAGRELLAGGRLVVKAVAA